MARSLIDKLKLLFNASIHDLVDRALKKDPIKTLNQYLRQHEDAIDEVISDLGFAGGKVKTANRKVTETQDKVDRIVKEIEHILTDDDPQNDYLAENLTQDLVDVEAQLEVYRQAEQSALRSQQGLSMALNKLKRRRNSLSNQIQLLEAIQFEADIKSMSAERLISSARVLSSGTVSVEALAESIKRNRDKADAEFEMAIGQVTTASEDRLTHTAAARLASIRQRLGVEASTSEDDSMDMTTEELALLEQAS